MKITIELTKGKSAKWKAEGNMEEISQTMIDEMSDTNYDISNWMDFKLRERAVIETQLIDSNLIPTNS